MGRRVWLDEAVSWDGTRGSSRAGQDVGARDAKAMSIFVSIAESILPKPVVMSIRVRRGLKGGRDSELGLLPTLARQGAFIDVGANIGTWTGPAARSFRSVYAFEPDTLIANALRRNVPTNVTVYEIALSDHEGVGEFRVPIYRGRAVRTRSSLESDVNPGCEEIVSKVQVSSLDALMLRGVDVIKIDVEGHEAAVLHGARETIERERPTLIVEIEDRHNGGRSESIIGEMIENAYSCCYVHADRLLEYENGSIDKLQSRALIPADGAKEKPPMYINNFIFIPQERGAEKSAISEYLANITHE